MIDSVLKGTGNSRFLKSAVPAGTSWADALAMLQAGTFPVDFNGINTEGFQQIGTPLNKANLLKDATAAQIGLPPSTTPDGMFQALGNTGELHVWRKTVTTAQEIPAKYELGELQTGSFQFVGSSYVTWEYGTPNVGDDGTVSLVSQGSSNVNYSSNLNDLRGKYCKPNQASGVFLANQVIFIPSDAVFTQSGSAKYISKYQPIIGTPKIPAGTTTTYPVSTNPNAYQEGDDAKPAGYTLGDVVTGKFAVSFYNAAEGYYYKVSGNIDVSSSGFVSMPSTSENVLIDYSHNNNTTAVKNKFAGKFVQFLYRNGGDGRKFPDTKPPFNGYDIVYIPDNVSVTQEKVISNKDFVVDRYQPVTGYAAIPAETTIEYLGKLGDKTRVQVVSYVGTGTYGSGHPNSLTFDFAPKIIFWVGVFSSGFRTYAFPAKLSTDYSQKDAIGSDENGYKYTKVSNDKKTIMWYHTSSSIYQLNSSGSVYAAIAIG